MAKSDRKGRSPMWGGGEGRGVGGKAARNSPADAPDKPSLWVEWHLGVRSF